MLGRLKAGPERRSANAGPLPIPEPIKPWSIGTSVNVAKYIKAPETDAKRLALKLFPPTKLATNFSGIRA